MGTVKLLIYYGYLTRKCELGSSVSIVTGYGLDDWGSIPDGGEGFFLYLLHPTMGTGDLP
jgi:hypothetical protein